MTNTGYAPGTFNEPGAEEQAEQAAGTAVDEGKRLTSVAGNETQKVATEAKEQGRALLDDARTQLEEQSRTQRDRFVQTLGTLGDDLDRMSGQADSGLASDLVGQAARRVRDLRGHLDGREPAELLDEVRSFARRRPGTFLLGAVAAGVVAGRMTRGAQKAHSTQPSSGTPAGTGMPAQRAGTPLAPDVTPDPAALPDTPNAPSMADFPPGRPGVIP